MNRPLHVHYHSSVRNVISPFLLQVLIRNQTYKNRFKYSVYENELKNFENTTSKNTPVNTNENDDNTDPLVDYSLVYESNTNGIVYFDVYDENEENNMYDENEENEPNDYLQSENDEPYVDFSIEYACYETFSNNTENCLALNRKPTNISLLEPSLRTLSQSESFTELNASKKRRIFLEPRVVLADPTKGVRFSFELPYIEVDETDEETFLNTKYEENDNIWGNYFSNCSYGLEK